MFVSDDVTPAERHMNRVGLLFGILFGGVVAGARLHEYDTIHAMLKLEELDVFWLMASAIGVSAPLLWWLERRGAVTPLGGRLSLSRSKPQRHHVTGGILFGIGWAIAGTCPAPALVMVSSGAMLGLVTIAGLFTGLRIHQHRNRTGTAEGDGEHRVFVGVGAPPL